MSLIPMGGQREAIITSESDPSIAIGLAIDDVQIIVVLEGLGPVGPVGPPANHSFVQQDPPDPVTDGVKAGDVWIKKPPELTPQPTFVWDGTEWLPIYGEDGTPTGGVFEYHQDTEVLVWTIMHLLHFEPQVTVFNPAGNKVNGWVDHLDDDHLTITFSEPVSGIAYLSGGGTAVEGGVPPSTIGPTGPQGATGPRGPTGLTGPTGTQGPVGAASTVVGPTGPTGPVGVVGPAGAKGDVGATGPTGVTGTVGPPGPIGTSGGTPMPIGAIIAFGGSLASVPGGWLPCDGTTRAKATYPDLAALVGTTFVVGDRTVAGTDFQLPNLSGRVPVGIGTASFNGSTGAVPVGASAHTLGQREGEERHYLTIAELAPHDHGGWTSPAYVYSSLRVVGGIAPQAAPNHTVGYGSAGYIDLPHQDTSLPGGNHYHQVGSQGGGSSHNVQQPYLGVAYIIKALADVVPTSDSGWLDFPFSTNWQSLATGHTPVQYRRRGPEVVLRGVIRRNTSTSAASSTIGIFPAGYRPTVGIVDFPAVVSDASVQRLTVAVDGTLAAVLPMGQGTFTSLDGMSFWID